MLLPTDPMLLPTDRMLLPTDRMLLPTDPMLLPTDPMLLLTDWMLLLTDWMLLLTDWMLLLTDWMLLLTDWMLIKRGRSQLRSSREWVGGCWEGRFSEGEASPTVGRLVNWRLIAGLGLGATAETADEIQLKSFDSESLEGVILANLQKTGLMQRFIKKLGRSHISLTFSNVLIVLKQFFDG
jgi:hypothetical protein